MNSTMKKEISVVERGIFGTSDVSAQDWNEA